MRTKWTILTSIALVLVLALLVILERNGGESVASVPTPPTYKDPLRIGLVPDREIIANRQRTRILADYLAVQLGRPVELVTGASYQTVLDDLRENRSDVAVLGSLITVLAIDRLDVRLLCKTDLVNGGSTYAGVICVREESPISDVSELAGRRIAMVRTTLAGNLFPVADFLRREMMEGDNAPKIVWVGTHDDAILAMVDGSVDAAALKDARLDVWMRENPGKRLRVLARSLEVPESIWVARSDLADVGEQVASVLLRMDSTTEGRQVLSRYGAIRFVPIELDEFRPVYRLIEQMGEAWDKLGIAGPAPKWPGGSEAD